MFQIDPIGESSIQRIAGLESVVATIRQPDSPEIDRLLEASLDRLRQTAATVSVVGQVKSGKSSLINALTGLGDFLPTEVNPWTAVITNIHFGHPDKPDSGAVFDLFSEAEWQRMIDGSPETRRLAEDLLPGFRSDVLQRQVLEMQQNAQKRLGGLYTLLLGKKHRFNEITPEVLERYVSAGYGDGVNPESSAGRFSGITKSANVFMPAGPFRVPVTLSDTPGINDPFLVRDEITTSSFKDADAFVVTLSAHQALGPADIALLKMLSVHSAKKTIVYVNRIDELDDPALSVPKLLEDLNARLGQELDRPNYLLLAGSAQWGRIAATGSDADVAAALESPAFRSIATRRLAIRTDAPRERLYAGSGMRDLAECISAVIDEGPAREALARAVTECGSAVDLLRQVLSERRERERGGLIETQDVSRIAATERARIEERSKRLSALASDLETHVSRGQGDILDNGDVVCISIHNIVETTVTSFVQGQTRLLRKAMAGESDMKSWGVDMAALSRRVETQVARGYMSGRQQIDRILLAHAEKLNEQITPVVGDIYIERILDNLPFDEILPAFKPQLAFIEMEFAVSRGWRFWRSKEMTPDEAMERLSNLIHAVVHPATEALMQNVREAVGKRNGAAMGRLRDMLTAARELIDGDIQALREEARAFSRGDDSERIAKIYQDRRKRAEELDDRIAVLERARAQLDEQFGDIAAFAARQTVDRDSASMRMEYAG